MLERQLTEDAHAILLLCGHFGKSNEKSEPLKIREYNTVAEWLVSTDMRPGDLLHEYGREELRNGMLTLDLSRLERLLDRGVVMSLDTEKWLNKGIWIVCRSDAEYPARLRSHLKNQAPPFLYVAGNPDLLEGGGLAIVGSRNVQADGERFTRRVARRCAEHGIPVISGGARGVDQTAMLQALEVEGTCIGVLADSLARAAVNGKYREHLRDGRLLLCTPYRPDAGFKPGLAMGRNKLVYAMADQSLVIQSEKDKGGTWTGAKEELRRAQPHPVFVRLEEPVPEGNQALLELGALPFPMNFFERPPLDALQDAALDPETTLAAGETTRADMGGSPDAKSSESARSDKQKKVAEPAPAYPFTTVLDAVRPLILSQLEEERTVDELAKMLDVNKTQLNAWLKILVKEKSVKKRTRPVRYVRTSQIEIISKSEDK